jgi:uncharacterized protein YhbP (UPF0306 family)
MRRVAPARLDAIARSLLDASTLFSIATVRPGGKAHVNTAYFAWSDRFDLVWLSDPSATHSRNLSGSASVAAAVYDSNQSWGGSDRGIQLFGAGRELDRSAAREAERTYAARFPAFRDSLRAGYRFFRLRPRRVKLFDEDALGAGVFVTAAVAGGRLTWVRTDVHRASGSGR